MSRWLAALVGICTAAMPVPLSARASEPITESGRAWLVEGVIAKAPSPHRNRFFVSHFLCKYHRLPGRKASCINGRAGWEQRPGTREADASTQIELFDFAYWCTLRDGQVRHGIGVFEGGRLAAITEGQRKANRIADGR